MVRTTSKEQGKHTQQKIVHGQKLFNIMTLSVFVGLNQMTDTKRHRYRQKKKK